MLSVVAVVACATLGSAQGASLQTCDTAVEPSATQHDRALRVAAILRDELEREGAQLALVARSGLDLERVGQRYSHAGVSLRASRHARWSVRQLYFACDERRPRVFDQGLAAFVAGMHRADQGWLSVVMLPPASEAALERSALDDRLALALLASDYSANAYPFSERYQNCNQWLAELLASAWDEPAGAEGSRARAQRWLHDQGYRPTPFALGWPPWRWLAPFLPWIRWDDHPPEDLAVPRFQVSMPESIEAFVRQREAGAQRLELCFTERHLVLRRGWGEPLATCEPGPGDVHVVLD